MHRILRSIIIFLLSFFLLTQQVSAKHLGLNEFYYKRNSEKKIALTFDDGPHPVYTKRILSILNKYNAKATFFIIGANVQHYGSVLDEIVLNGHELGNHTFSHENIKNKSAESIVSELENCTEVIYKKCGQRTNLFRPPGGIMADICISNTTILSDYKIIYWSIDTRDWEHQSSENIAKNVISKIQPGDIILMHDYIGKNSPTPAALEIIIPQLQKQGYEFVTVSELLSS